jgi:hypothetical protein
LERLVIIGQDAEWGYKLSAEFGPIAGQKFFREYQAWKGKPFPTRNSILSLRHWDFDFRTSAKNPRQHDMHLQDSTRSPTENGPLNGKEQAFLVLPEAQMGFSQDVIGLWIGDGSHCHGHHFRAYATFDDLLFRAAIAIHNSFVVYSILRR